MAQSDEYQLSQKDIQIFVRQLAATATEEHLASGKFDLDIVKFGANEQLRIRRELQMLIRNLNSVDGKGLPPEKPGRPRKQKEEKKEHVEGN